MLLKELWLLLPNLHFSKHSTTVFNVCSFDSDRKEVEKHSQVHGFTEPAVSVYYLCFVALENGVTEHRLIDE